MALHHPLESELLPGHDLLPHVCFQVENIQKQGLYQVILLKFRYWDAAWEAGG